MLKTIFEDIKPFFKVIILLQFFYHNGGIISYLKNITPVYSLVCATTQPIYNPAVCCGRGGHVSYVVAAGMTKLFPST